MKPAPFQYHAATTAAEALQLLAELGDDAKLLAGGQSLIPMMNFRLAQPKFLVDINPVTELDFIRVEPPWLVIGARTRYAQLERSASAARMAPILAEAVRFVGHPPIRHLGTVGGSLAHGDPAAELPTAALALDGELVIRNLDGERTVPAAAFFKGLFTTALGPADLLAALKVPLWPERSGWAFLEFSRRQGGFALVGTAVMLALEDGRISRAGIALCGVSRTPVRATEAEQMLIGSEPSLALASDAAQRAAKDLRPAADIHATPDYRRRVAAVYLERAIRLALERAGGQS